jgi:hypothetical protein
MPMSPFLLIAAAITIEKRAMTRAAHVCVDVLLRRNSQRHRDDDHSAKSCRGGQWQWLAARWNGMSVITGPQIDDSAGQLE